MSSPDRLSTSSSDCSEIGADPGTLLNGGFNGFSNPTIGAGIPISVFYCRVGASPQAQQSNPPSINPGLNGITLSSLGLPSLPGGGPPTDERCVLLNERIPIGRAVAKLKPAPTNLIFDCKVLSRSHAVLWYEDGKFLLQDSKSSNGTYVNADRLSKANEESLPHELFCNDVVQFGVDIAENSKKGAPIMHGCIVATVQLYHPDGREALRSSSKGVVGMNGAAKALPPGTKRVPLSDELDPFQGLGPVDDTVRRFGAISALSDVFDSPSQYARQHPHPPELASGTGGGAGALSGAQRTGSMDMIPVNAAVGAQAAQSQMGSPGVGMRILVRPAEMLQLTTLLVEAATRERTLATKVKSLETVLEAVNQSAESAWHASLAEEKLTSRIAELEELLHLYIVRFGDERAFGGRPASDEKGGKELKSEKLDLDAIEEDVRDIRKQLELCSVASNEDCDEKGERKSKSKSESEKFDLEELLGIGPASDEHPNGPKSLHREWERPASGFHAELAALVASKHASEAGARMHLAELLRTGADLESKLRMAREQADQARNEMSVSEARYNETRECLERLTGERDELTTRANKLDQQLQEREREHGERLVEVERARDALMSEVAALQTRIEQLQAQLAALDAELARARRPDTVDEATSANSSGWLQLHGFHNEPVPSLSPEDNATVEFSTLLHTLVGLLERIQNQISTLEELSVHADVPVAHCETASPASTSGPSALSAPAIDLDSGAAEPPEQHVGNVLSAVSGVTALQQQCLTPTPKRRVLPSSPPSADRGAAPPAPDRQAIEAPPPLSLPPPAAAAAAPLEPDQPDQFPAPDAPSTSCSLDTDSGIGTSAADDTAAAAAAAAEVKQAAPSDEMVPSADVQQTASCVVEHVNEAPPPPPPVLSSAATATATATLHIRATVLGAYRDTFREVYDLLLRVRSALVLASSQSQLAAQSQLAQSAASAASSPPAQQSTPQDQCQLEQPTQPPPSDSQECPVPEPSDQQPPAEQQTADTSSLSSSAEPNSEHAATASSFSSGESTSPAAQPMPVCPDSGEIEPPESVLLLAGAASTGDDAHYLLDVCPPPPPPSANVSTSDENRAPTSLTTITLPAVEPGIPFALLEGQRNEIERLRTLCECNERASQIALEENERLKSTLDERDVTVANLRAELATQRSSRASTPTSDRSPPITLTGFSDSASSQAPSSFPHVAEDGIGRPSIEQDREQQLLILRDELDDANRELAQIRRQSRMASASALIPVLILLFAMTIALYNWLSNLF